MPIQYKVDVIAALKEKGYNTNKIREGLLIGQSYTPKFRNKARGLCVGKPLTCNLLSAGLPARGLD